MNRSTSLTQNPTLVRRNLAVATDLVRTLQEGSYVALLGPHFAGKTGIIHAVEDLLTGQMGWPWVYVDFYELEASTQREFFAALTELMAERVAEWTAGQSRPASLDRQEATSAAFRGFLTDIVRGLDRDLVLLLDHLEVLPNDLCQVMLTSLRAVYMEQQNLEHRIMVAVSGALSLAAVTLGESSPFRGIARRIFVGGLSEAESEAFLDEQIESNGMDATDAARKCLFHAAGGDPHLLWRIYRDAADRARQAGADTLDAEAVEQTTDHFLAEEVAYYAPLQEAVRTIEQDPDLLRSVLLLLEQESVPMSTLPLPLSPDLDPLRLSGVVERMSHDHYRLRNGIYRRFLARHLNPGRVGYLLTTSGRWDSAIDYLEASVLAGSEEYRWDLVTAIVNSMYASEDVGRAAHYLLRGLSAAFGIRDAQVWYAPVHEQVLRLVAVTSASGTDGARTGTELPITEDCLQARAYRESASLRGPESSDCVQRALPLLAPGRRPISVVTLQDCQGGSRFSEQRERELQLSGYLNQAGRALEQVGKRTQELALAGRVQAGLLPTTPGLPGWELSALLKPARQTAGDFFDFIPLPGGRLGIVVADVADKGLGAALYMTLARTLIRTFAPNYPDRPEKVLRNANVRMLADAGVGLFVTVFYGILDPGSGRLVYCNAGHHPGFVSGVSADAPLRPMGPTGMALGVMADATWQQDAVQIAPGELLLLYTDGVVEAQNRTHELFGPERMLQVISQGAKSAREAQDAMMAAILDFVGGESQSDDITLVVARRMPELAEPRAEPALRPAEPRPRPRPGAVTV